MPLPVMDESVRLVLPVGERRLIPPQKAKRALSEHCPKHDQQIAESAY
jgi:hypothetical protein